MLFDGMGGLSLSLSASRTFSGGYWTHLKYSCDYISVCACPGDLQVTQPIRWKDSWLVRDVGGA